MTEQRKRQRLPRALRALAMAAGLWDCHVGCLRILTCQR